MQHRYYLIGFMGSGKTTIGEALAKKINYNVIDLDEWIEKSENQKITTIFEEKGESHFRELETEALKKVNDEELIVTTGGGIVIKKENRQLMREKGTIIYLQCDMDEIFKRLEGDDSRPNFSGEPEQIKALFQSRKAFYEEADYIVDTTGKSVEQIINEVQNMLKLT